MQPRNKSDQHIPWWMYVVAVSYILTLGLIVYLLFWGPAQLDTAFTIAFSQNAMEVLSVNDPNSPVAKGGLVAGDRVVMIDDVPIKNVRDWTAATGNSKAGGSQTWTVLRGGDRLALKIVPVGVDLRSKFDEGYLYYISNLLTAFFLGLLIAWKRPSDAIARLGAWFLITASMAAGFPHGWAVPWRAVPSLLQWLLWIPQLSRFVLEGIFLSFFLVFPRRLVTRRWIWFVVWTPVLITMPWRVKAFYGVIQPGQVTAVPAWILTAGLVRTMLYMVAGIVVLGVSYRRFLDINEKRRVRLLMLGTGIWLANGIVLVWFDTFSGRQSAVGAAILTPSVAFGMLGPFGIAYAILRHRVLDVTVIIRQGLQYAFARGGVIGFVPAMGALFVLDLTLNSNQRVADIFRSRGWVYAVAAALSLIAYWKRREWLESLDRRFFRERYNAQQLLRDVSGEIRSSGGFESAAARVIERIEASLHPEFASVLVRSVDEAAYRSVATYPQGHVPPHLTADSKVVALLHVLGKPLELLLGDSAWLDERLPRDESEFVRNARIDLLVPIASGPTQREALLALGVKRSEEPYTREDQELLETIATGLAILLEQPAAPVERRVTFKECPECGVCYEPVAMTCLTDKAQLMVMQIPRTLAGRYKLDRRRGRGGMGTVYEAIDSSLERRVAIKLIREDWTDRAEALQRFRREARASASFAHPNVVTIYDYGIEGDTRAFLVMELLQGRTLRDELKQHQRLALSHIVDIFRGVCAAVEAAHARNLIHRDLKPENIFLTGNTVKVLDFGVAKFLPSRDASAPTRLSSATQAGILVGTPAYMSPEQLLGEDLNVLWDLWAMAVAVYETLTGALPFVSATGADSRRAVLTGTFTPLDKYLENPPEKVEALFTRAFASDPAKRPQLATEFLSLLQEMFASQM
jgi:hypothetical protein